MIIIINSIINSIITIRAFCRPAATRLSSENIQ